MHLGHLAHVVVGDRLLEKGDVVLLDPIGEHDRVVVVETAIGVDLKLRIFRTFSDVAHTDTILADRLHQGRFRRHGA